MARRDAKVVAEIEHQLAMGKANRLAWVEKAAFMRDVGATDATWGEDDELLALKLAPQQPRQTSQPPAGPAAKVAEAFKQRLKRDHETRFAASHFKPRLDVPVTQDDVPRAVRDRGASDGRPPNKSQRR